MCPIQQTNLEYVLAFQPLAAIVGTIFFLERKLRGEELVSDEGLRLTLDVIGVLLAGDYRTLQGT